MPHYAFTNDDNEVIELITGRDENDLENLPEGFESWEEYYLTKRPDAHQCLRTSYNTKHNIHHKDGEAFRGNLAFVGGYYYPEHDIFMPPQPYPSWTLNTVTAEWDCPVAPPSDVSDDDKVYEWNEEDQSWDLVEE